MSYYVVRRAFRAKHGALPVGSIVEPTGVSNFKYRLGERHIVHVTEQNFARYASLFKERYGIEIPDPAVDSEAAEQAAKEAAEQAAKEAAEQAAKEAAEQAAKAVPIATVIKASVIQ